MSLQLRGCGTAIVTPFTSSGAVDTQALRRHVEWQLAQGVEFLVPCGSTGEAQTLGPEERRQVVETTLEVVAGRAPVVGGVSGNDTARVVEEARAVSGYGVDAVMVVTPYYNKPTQAGLERHFSAVADASPRPVLIYTVPGRTAVHIAPETVVRLARHPNVMGIKDATGDLHWAMEVIRNRPAGFAVLSGEDGLILPHLACGGDGLISVAANVVPGPMAQLVKAGLDGDFGAAREVQLRLLPLMDTLFRETNPIPAKAALYLMGRMRNELRLPLVPASSSTVELLKELLAEDLVTERSGAA
jgi:4-hydroxy-tetrahydrodipicolinate synthase